MTTKARKAALGLLIECPECKRRVSGRRYVSNLRHCVGMGNKDASASIPYGAYVGELVASPIVHIVNTANDPHSVGPRFNPIELLLS